MCLICRIVKPLEDFPYQHNRKRHLSKCCECKRVYDRTYWSKTKDRRNSQKKKNTTAIRERNTLFLLNYLNAHPCVVCGEADPLVLEFDHIDPTTKTANVSELLGTSIARIVSEIHKCRVLCANCHRRETAKQFQYGMWKLINGV